MTAQQLGFEATTKKAAPFTIGQRVRFRECPSLVGVVTKRDRDDEGGWLYTVRGCAEDRILGMYRREHLEACK